MNKLSRWCRARSTVRVSVLISVSRLTGYAEYFIDLNFEPEEAQALHRRYYTEYGACTSYRLHHSVEMRIHVGLSVRGLINHLYQ
jgi:hypothetical protein